MKHQPFSREAATGARLNLRESIVARIFAWCLLAALAPLLLVQGVSHFYLASALRRDAQARISLIGEQKLRLLKLFFDDCEGDAAVLSRTPVLVRALPEMTAAAAQRGGYSSERYRAASQMPFEHLRAVVTTCGYADALLVSTSGDVLLATSARPELGTNLRTGRHRDTELTRVLETARATMRPAISSFRIHPPTGRAAIFAAAPMVQGRALAGFVVIEINREAITALTRDYAGLGATGDIWLGEVRGGRLLMLNPTRDNKVPAFQPLPWTGSKTSPLVLASEGKSGSGVMKDFRGVSGIAWWSYQPQLKCGLVVRMDESEALAGPASSHTLALWTALVSAVFALVAAWLAARSIAAPVQALERGVRRITGGDWEHRVGQEGHGEVGRLGRSFDQMLDRLKAATDSHDELNLEIEARKKAEAEMRQLNADLDRRVGEHSEELDRRANQFNAETKERLKAQEALADQLTFVAAMFNAIPYPIFVTDADARFVSCNRTCEEAFGIKSEDLRGRTVLDLDFLPEEARLDLHDEELAVIREGGRRRYELPITFADGQEHATIYSVESFRRDDGQPGGLIGLLIDITDRKRIEQELAAAKETAAAAVSAIEAKSVADQATVRLQAEAPAPPAAEAGEPEPAAECPASEAEPEASKPEAVIKRRSRSRRAPAPGEVESVGDEEPPADDPSPPPKELEAPVEAAEAEVAEEPVATSSDSDQAEPVEPPPDNDAPAQAPLKRTPRARKPAAPSPQQELFALDAPPAEAPTKPAPPAARPPAKAAASPALLDVKALRLSLWTLESLLRNDDIDAQAELEALLPQVKGTAFEVRFTTLAREVAGGRFESAVAELERIKTDLAG